MNTETVLTLLRLLTGTGFVYVLYRVLLKKRVNGNAGRFFLLAGTVLFSLLPFLPQNGTDTGTGYLVLLPETAAGSPAGATNSTRIHWLNLIYFTVTGVSALLFVLKLLRLLQLSRSGVQTSQNGIRITETGKVRFPFSFGSHIFLPADMDSRTRRLVLEHEQVHIRHRHTLDVLLFECLKIIGWFNPFYYLLEKELRQTHEFTADEIMLQNGVPVSRYSEALLSCALAGMRVPVNYFHGSQIKTRIYMMNKPKNKRRAAALLLTAVLVSAGMALATPRLMGQTPAQKEAFTAVEQMPEYPGGNEAMARYLTDNIRYPAEAEKAKTEGKVLLGFIVDKTGKVSDVKVERSLSKETDAEAVRVVNAMPLWRPGKQNGKEVAVKMVLPIVFKLN